MNIQDLERLSNAEKILLVEQIWDSINKDEIPITDAQKKELDRRLDKHASAKTSYRSWDEVKQKQADRK